METTLIHIYSHNHTYIALYTFPRKTSSTHLFSIVWPWDHGIVVLYLKISSESSRVEPEISGSTRWQHWTIAARHHEWLLALQVIVDIKGYCWHRGLLLTARVIADSASYCWLCELLLALWVIASIAGCWHCWLHMLLLTLRIIVDTMRYCWYQQCTISIRTHDVNNHTRSQHQYDKMNISSPELML